MKAIIQLQETAEKLIDKNLPIDEIFIVSDGIGKPERGAYKRIGMKGKNDKFLFDKNRKRYVEISHKGKSFSIKLFYTNETC